MIRNAILQGNVIEQLQTLPDKCVQCCFTSPPYWMLRSYLSSDHPLKTLEIGLESTLEEYIDNLVKIFAEVWRVLRDDGVLWVNIGDSHANYNYHPNKKQGNPVYNKNRPSRELTHTPVKLVPLGMKKKSLFGIPWRLAFALQDFGWILRSEIIWNKTNCLPESCTDRPTKSHETVFLFAKKQRYFYDADAVRTPLKDKTYTTFGSQYQPQGNDPSGNVKSANWNGSMDERKPRLDADGNPAGANLRSVWDIAVSTYDGAHFAVMPEQIARNGIRAGSSPYACEKCNAPWRRQTKKTAMVVRPGPKAGQYNSRTTDHVSGTMVKPPTRQTIGFEPTCLCDNEGKGKCIVLDPFMGSGTTGFVSIEEGRDYIGVDINQDYINLAHKRIETAQPRLWAD